MYLKPGILYDKNQDIICEILRIKNNMFQIIKFSKGKKIWACGLNEHEAKRFKRMNKLFYKDELQRMNVND